MGVLKVVCCGGQAVLLLVIQSIVRVERQQLGARAARGLIDRVALL